MGATENYFEIVDAPIVHTVMFCFLYLPLGHCVMMMPSYTSVGPIGDGMNNPLCIQFYGNIKKLHVTISMHTVCSTFPISIIIIVRVQTQSQSHDVTLRF